MPGGGGGWRSWTLGSLGLGLAARLVTGPLPLNYYDIGYALGWGREIVHGHLPHYRMPAASTPHPLATAFGAFAALFGTRWSWYVVQALLFISLGAVGVALFRLVLACFASRGAALLAAGALLLSPPFLTDALGLSGLPDLPALALVLAAAALEAQRPRRGVAPLVLLALAGLLRPEAWGLSAVYWLYLAAAGPPLRELLARGALVLAAPVLWVLSDLAVVSDATYSLTNTQAASTRGFFKTGLSEVPHAALRDLRTLLGLPVLVVGALGAALAVRNARRAAILPAALLALALAEFATLGIARVPLLERFLLLAAAMLSAFFGYAVVAGRERARPARLRSAWLAAAVALVGFVGASDAARLRHIRRDQRATVHAEADLVAFARDRRVRAAVRSCRPLYAARFTLVSLVAYDFDLLPASIRRAPAQPPPRGLVLVPASASAGAKLGVDAARLRALHARTLAPFHAVAANRSWLLYARGCS
jgi:hypothetical protein